MGRGFRRVVAREWLYLLGFTLLALVIWTVLLGVGWYAYDPYPEPSTDPRISELRDLIRDAERWNLLWEGVGHLLFQVEGQRLYSAGLWLFGFGPYIVFLLWRSVGWSLRNRE